GIFVRNRCSFARAGGPGKPGADPKQEIQLVEFRAGLRDIPAVVSGRRGYGQVLFMAADTDSPFPRARSLPGDARVRVSQRKDVFRSLSGRGGDGETLQRARMEKSDRGSHGT